MKSKSFLISSTSFFICSGETLDLSFVCADGSRYNSGNLLSFISACLRRQLPSMTSTILYTIRFSRPMTTSRFRSPRSVSITMTFFPRFDNPIPMFAVVVVFPTPPFPDVMTITSPMLVLLLLYFLTFILREDQDRCGCRLQPRSSDL